jgi:anti-anti-sigma regulatory factor
MFTVGYSNRAMIISAVNEQHINCRNVEDFRRLVIQLLRNPCGKLILDFQGIEIIDRPAIEVIGRLRNLAVREQIIVEFVNIQEKVSKLFIAAGVNLTLPVDDCRLSKTKQQKI